jgi:hypothetical protein
MTVRVWLHNRLKAAAAVTVPDDRILSSSGIQEGMSPPEKPFIVVEIGVADPYEGTREYRVGGPDAGPRVATAQRATIWIHNEPGDYETIDTLMVAVRDSLMSAPPDQVHNVLEARLVQESEDLPDDGLGTITRFSRWQIVTSR